MGYNAEAAAVFLVKVKGLSPADRLSFWLGSLHQRSDSAHAEAVKIAKKEFDTLGRWERANVLDTVTEMILLDSRKLIAELWQQARKEEA